MEWVEIIGLSASLTVFLSFLFNNQVVMRIVNIVGAVLFVVYAIIIGAFSVWVVNGGLILVHLYKLTRIYIQHRNSHRRIVYNYNNKKMVIKETGKRR